MQGMLAEPAADFIHGFIEAAHFVHPHGVVEQGVLDGEIGSHLHEHHPGCPVIYPLAEEGKEGLPGRIGQLHRVFGRPVETHFTAVV